MTEHEQLALAVQARVLDRLARQLAALEQAIAEGQPKTAEAEAAGSGRGELEPTRGRDEPAPAQPDADGWTTVFEAEAPGELSRAPMRPSVIDPSLAASSRPGEPGADRVDARRSAPALGGGDLPASSLATTRPTDGDARDEPSLAESSGPTPTRTRPAPASAAAATSDATSDPWRAPLRLARPTLLEPGLSAEATQADVTQADVTRPELTRPRRPSRPRALESTPSPDDRRAAPGSPAPRSPDSNADADRWSLPLRPTVVAPARGVDRARPAAREPQRPSLDRGRPRGASTAQPPTGARAEDVELGPPARLPSPARTTAEPRASLAVATASARASESRPGLDAPLGLGLGLGLATATPDPTTWPDAPADRRPALDLGLGLGLGLDLDAEFDELSRLEERMADVLERVLLEIGVDR